jgi:hypothetical protein
VCPANIPSITLAGKGRHDRGRDGGLSGLSQSWEGLNVASRNTRVRPSGLIWQTVIAEGRTNLNDVRGVDMGVIDLEVLGLKINQLGGYDNSIRAQKEAT